MVHFSEALLSTDQKAAFQRAADRWEEVITGDLRDVDFRLYPYNEWNEIVNAQITVTDVVDDLRIFVRIKNLEEEIAGHRRPVSDTNRKHVCRSWARLRLTGMS